MAKVVEFRGVDNLVYAEVIEDTIENYITGTVKRLAPVAEISKTTEYSTGAKYYDNAPAIVIGGEGADTITLTCAIPDLVTYADIIGKDIDEETGAFIDSERELKYFALGYRFKKTDGTYRYVWRFKGSFNIPAETSVTEDDGTDGNNIQLEFTGIATTHYFTKNNKKSKGIVIDDTSESKVDISKFFEDVKTPDNITLKEDSIVSGVDNVKVDEARVGEDDE